MFTLPGEDARNEQVALSRVRRAEMVKAFIESGEYRRPFFGASSGNQEGQAAETDAQLLSDFAQKVENSCVQKSSNAESVGLQG